MALLQALFKERSHWLLLLVVGLATVGFFIIFSPFLMSIILAGIFSLFISMAIRNLRQRSISRKSSAAIYATSLIITLFLTMTAGHAALRTYNLTVGVEREKTVFMAQAIKIKVEAGLDKILKRLDRFGGSALFAADGLPMRADEVAKRMFARGVTVISDSFAKVPSFIVSTLVFVLFMIMLVSRRETIYEAVLSSSVISKNDLDRVLTVAQNASYSVFFSNFVVGFSQAFIITTGAYLIGQIEWSIIFLLSFICSFLPVVGTAPVTLALSLISFASANPQGAIVLLVLVALNSVIDSVVRPLLVSRLEHSINPAVALVGIIGAITYFGFSGLFLGPFLMAFVVGIWPYFNKVMIAHAVRKGGDDFSSDVLISPTRVSQPETKFHAEFGEI